MEHGFAFAMIGAAASVVGVFVGLALLARHRSAPSGSDVVAPAEGIARDA